MKKWITRAGLALAGIAGIAVLLIAILNGVSYYRQQHTYALDVAPLAIRSDPAALERGRHLVNAVGICTECHAADLGGRSLVGNVLMGRIAAANLTRGAGGLGADYTDADLVRAIRHGVGRNGKSLIFMPSESYRGYSDFDLAAIIAYLHTIAPVDRTLPPTWVGPIARVLHIVGFPLLPAELVDHNAVAATPEPGVTVAYGDYLATVTCKGCHGPALAGGDGPGPNITSGPLEAWTEADFRRALREGRRPDGTTLSDEMPWKAFAQMTDDEIAALWKFERSLPPVQRQGK